MDKTFYTEENPIRFPYAAKYKPDEKKLVVYYDIQDVSAPTTICTNYDNSVKSIEVDGELLDSIVTTYQFGSVGEHIIKYEFNDPTTVGKYAPLFSSITTIKRVVIPNTFTAIGSNAFNSCSSLTSIAIPDSVTSIGNSAFSACSSLTSVTIPNSITSIGDSTFYSCTSLTSVTIPNGVISIGNGAFKGCSGLTSVTIPNSVTSIDNFAFENCSAIRELFYNAQCEINTSFKGWGNALEKVVIGDSTPSIGQGTFTGCSSLTSVIIGSGVTTIGSGVFYGCSSLTSITIPSSVTSIDAGVFQYCSGLQSITSLATTAPTINNSTFYNVKTNGILTVPSGSSGYDVWMGTGDYYLGSYGWTKVEQ